MWWGWGQAKPCPMPPIFLKCVWPRTIGLKKALEIVLARTPKIRDLELREACRVISEFLVKTRGYRKP